MTLKYTARDLSAALAKGREEAAQWHDREAERIRNMAQWGEREAKYIEAIGDHEEAAAAIRALSPSSPGGANLRSLPEEIAALAAAAAAEADATTAEGLFSNPENITTMLHKHVRSLVRAIRLLAPSSPGELAGSGWLPIASAPRDGSWFLVCNFDSPMCWAPYEFASWTTDYSGRSYYCQEDTSEETEATHWMLLPAPPHEPTGET